MTAGDMLIEQGREEGLLQGICRVVLTLLAQRFGALPPAVITRVQAADLPALDRWSKRILLASSLADVLQEP